MLVEPDVADDVVAQPLNILLPLVKLHVELFHDGNVHDEPGVHSTLALQVPEPPFLFNVIVILFNFGAAVPPAQV